MSDLANLQIRVQSIEAELADKRLDDLAKTGAKAEKATNGLTSAFLKFAGPAALVAGSVATLSKVVSVTREFGTLNAQLITATGSATNAAIAFDAIQDFATRTPFDLAQVTTSFTKLVNLGLDPSEAALESYGNTASAMGKDLNQLIEAVADATTGEFERLKEFGIKTKTQGDQISFTFRGVSTTIGKNAAEIEGYLKALGENEFAGAMNNRMDTLGGAISNLEDEWNKLFLNISNQGVGTVITDSVRSAIDVIEELNAIVASGQLEAGLDSIAIKFAGFGRDISNALDQVNTELGDAGITDFLNDALRDLPDNVRAMVQIFAVELASIVDLAEVYGQGFGDVLGNKLETVVAKAKVYGRALLDALDPLAGADAINLTEELEKLDRVSDAVSANLENNIERVSKTRLDSISSILDERQAALDAFDEQIKLAGELREQYEFLTASKQAFRILEAEGFGIEDLGRGKALKVTYEGVTQEIGKSEVAFNNFLEQLDVADAKTQDVIKQLRTAGADLSKLDPGALGQFKIKPDGEKGESDAEATVRKNAEKEAEKLAKIKADAFEDLRKSLRTEEEAIQESYDARLAIIIGSTEAGSTAQSTLTERLNGELALQKEKLATSRGAALDGLRESLRTEEEVIQESYNKRLEIILANTEEGSAQQAELKARLDKQFGEEAIGDLNVVDTYDEQLEELNNFYERRKALILENSQITEEERTALEEQLTAQRNERLAAMEAARTSMVLNAGSQIFGGLADLSKQFAGEQSGIYKTMFAASKAFAVADSVVKIQTGIASAAALPFPANLGAIGSVISATSGIVSTINGTNFSGAMDAGGIIPQGKVGLVGEFGPELVAGPTNVRSRRDTAEMFKAGKEKEAAPVAPPQVNVRNINVLDPAVVGDYLATDAGEQMIMNVVQRNQRSIGF